MKKQKTVKLLDDMDFTNLMNQFQLFDRIWSGNSEILVKAKHLGGDVSAYTEGQDIYINKNFFEGKVESKVLQILLAKGLNLHELCHVLWTDVYDVRKQLLDNEWKAFNILEDGRVETILADRYGLAGKYFRVLSGKLLSAEWLLLYGRKTFLPASWIAKAEALCKYDDDKKERVRNIFDEYIVSDTNNKRVVLAKALALELGGEASLLGNKTGEPRDGYGALKSQENAKNIKGKLDKSKQDIEQSKQNLDKSDEVDLKEEIEAELSDLDDNLLDDLKNIMDRIDASDVDFNSVGKSSAGYNVENLGRPDGRELLLKNQLVNVFRELEFTNRGSKGSQTSGRLVIRDAFRHQKDNGLRIFNRQVRQTDTDISAAILIDFSGSMNQIVSDCAKVSRAMWSALKSVGQNAIVIGFDTEPVMIADEGKFKQTVPVKGGGTEPEEAYEIACKHLSKKSGNRLIIIVSDGEFDFHGVNKLSSIYNIPTIMVCWNSQNKVDAKSLKGVNTRFVKDQSEVSTSLKKSIREWMKKI